MVVRFRKGPCLVLAGTDRDLFPRPVPARAAGVGRFPNRPRETPPRKGRQKTTEDRRGGFCPYASISGGVSPRIRPARILGMRPAGEIFSKNPCFREGDALYSHRAGASGGPSGFQTNSRPFQTNSRLYPTNSRPFSTNSRTLRAGRRRPCRSSASRRARRERRAERISALQSDS